ncbi:hypothetical protein ACFV3E_23125 [Streptomyces sp. NPDC059718]
MTRTAAPQAPAWRADRTVPEMAAATRPTDTAFAGLGLAGATWSSRLPRVRAHLQPGPAALGLLLLTVGVGGVLVLPLSGPMVARVGPRRAVTVVAPLVGTGLGAIAFGYTFCPPLMVVGLFMLGPATGCWDVAMTVHAATVGRRLGRVLMPRCAGSALHHRRTPPTSESTG